MKRGVGTIGMMAAVALMATMAVASRAEARGCGVGCGVCGPAFQLVEKTIMVPTMVREQRTVHQTVCEPEVREKVVTVVRCVPETRPVVQTYTVMVPEPRTKVQTFTVCKPVQHEVEQQYTVMVPYTEVRQGVRRVCQRVPVETTRTVCRDMGQWEDRTVEVCGAGGCAGCGVACVSPCVKTYRVWVPNIVREEVPVTVWKKQIVEEPYEFEVTLRRPEQRVRTVTLTKLVHEQQQREVTFTVCVPQQREREVQVTTLRKVPEERTVQFTVMVPRTVERVVDVSVCRMVPKTITCKVPVYQGCH